MKLYNPQISRTSNENIWIDIVENNIRITVANNLGSFKYLRTLSSLRSVSLGEEHLAF